MVIFKFNKKANIFFLFFLFLFFLSPAFSQNPPSPTQPESPIVVDADVVNYDAKLRSINAKGNVKIVYQDIQAFCDEAQVDTQTKIGKLKGNVRIVHEQGTAFGDNITYDFANKTAEIREVFFESEPFYASAVSARRISEKEYRFDNACLTTCGPLNKEQHFFDYTIHAKEMIFYPGDKVVAKNVLMKINKVPILYMPFYIQPAKDKLPRVTLVPGHDEDMGVFMRSAWRYYFSEAFKGRIHLDYYEHEGIGKGFTHKYTTENFGEGIAKFYYLDDRDSLSFDKPTPYATGPDRYKAQIRHNWQVTDNLNATLEFHKFSDNYFMKDFFLREYEKDVQPESYLLLNYALPNSSLSLFTQKRVNRFWAQTEYLPRLRYELFRQPLIGNTYIQTDYSLANLTQKNASPSSLDSDALRADFYNRFGYQNKLGWLNLEPFVSLRETYYSKNTFGDPDIFRTILSSGVTIFTKLYKQSTGPIDFLGMKAQKLRHILTPIFEYSYVHRPTVASSALMQFDDIDSIGRENKVSFTLENKVQVKKEGQTRDLLYFAPVIDYIIGEEGRGSHFNELNYDLEFRPFDNLYVEQNFKYDLNRKRVIKEVNSDIVLSGILYQLSLGHRYVRGDRTSQITGELNYKITPTWEFNGRLRYEAREGDVKEQEFYIRKEINCWYVDFGVTVDKEYNKTFWVIFRVKAFPEAGIDFHQSYSRPKE